MAPGSREVQNIAVFIDLENLVLGIREAKLRKFEPALLFGRLVEKGSLLYRKAYANWSRFEEYKRPLHEAGVELVDIPGSRLSGKNSADIKMVVDALELAYTNAHVDSFALATGDSDFAPLVAKLRLNNKHTLGVGVKQSTSRILIDSCDEFIFYDDLVRAPARKGLKKLAKLTKKKRDAFSLLLEAGRAIQREGLDLHSSLVKDTMKRKQPQFNEEYHGYRSFSSLLEDAEKQGLIALRKDERSGTWVIAKILEESV